MNETARLRHFLTLSYRGFCFACGASEKSSFIFRRGSEMAAPYGIIAGLAQDVAQRDSETVTLSWENILGSVFNAINPSMQDCLLTLQAHESE